SMLMERIVVAKTRNKNENENEKEKEKEEKYLVAYLILKKQEQDEKESNINVTSLREFLKEKLPEYMIPSIFIILEKLPLNSNGKVDRKSLPDPYQKEDNNSSIIILGVSSSSSYSNDNSSTIDAPRNKIEEKLVEIWK